MKTYLGRMVGASMGLSFDDQGAGGGGGAAVAPPPAAATPAAPAAAAPASAPAESFSFFRNLPQREEAAAAKPEAAAPAQAAAPEKPFVVTDDTGKPIEGAAFATKEEAEAYIAKQGKGGEVAPAGEKTLAELAAEELAAQAGTKTEAAPAGAVKIAPDAVLETPIFGRFKTVKETEAYIKQSGEHAQKLADENKRLKADVESALATRDADLAAAKAELEAVRNTPTFKELTQDEYDKLGADEKVDYKFAKRDHDERVQRAKDDAARTTRERQQSLQAARAEIERVVGEMESDEKNYPMFRAVDPLMGKIHESLGGKDSPLNGDPRAVNLYYRAAMGSLYISLLSKGKVAKAEATEESRKAAAAAAAAATAPAGTSTTTPPKPKTAQEIKDEQWRKSIKDAAPKKVLTFGD